MVKLVSVNTWFPLAGGVAPPKLPVEGFTHIIFVSRLAPELSTYSPTTKMGEPYDPVRGLEGQFLPTAESHAPI